MTKVAIVTRKLILGGVERALIAMLRSFDYSKVKVDLYVEHLEGELLQEVPLQVTVRELQTLEKGQFWRHPLAAAQKAGILFYLHRKKRPFIRECYLSSKLLLPIKEKYDIAISYHAPNTVPVFYVIDKMQAAKKILWLHGDLEKNAGDDPLAMEYHSKYDKVVAVCQSVYDSFLKYHPTEGGKVEVFYNIMDEEGIKKKAEVGPTYTDDFSGTRILSIARLDQQKGVDMAIEACAKLIEGGRKIRWYICGEGMERPALEKMIMEKGLKGTFILLGNQKNPYRYLRDCDLYVQSSRTEGYCITTSEAKIFAKPIVTTDVPGAREKFIDGVTGWIVPVSADAIAEKLEWLLDHPGEWEKVKSQILQSQMRKKQNNINELLEREK